MSPAVRYGLSLACLASSVFITSWVALAVIIELSSPEAEFIAFMLSNGEWHQPAWICAALSLGAFLLGYFIDQRMRRCPGHDEWRVGRPRRNECLRVVYGEFCVAVALWAVSLNSDQLRNLVFETLAVALIG